MSKAALVLVGVAAAVGIGLSLKKSNKRVELLNLVKVGDIQGVYNMKSQFSDIREIATIDAYVSASELADPQKPLDDFAGALVFSGAATISENGGLAWADAYAQIGRNDIARKIADLAVGL